MLRKRGAALSPQDEWRALGLDLDVRVCFFGTTKVRGTWSREAAISPVSPRPRRCSCSGPRTASCAGRAPCRSWPTRAGSAWARFWCAPAPSRGGSRPVAARCSSKRSAWRARCRPRALRCYLVSHLGRRQWPLRDAPDYVQFDWADYVGCCVSPGPRALEEAATRLGFFDAAAELRQKSGFVGFLQRNCGSSTTVQPHIRHAFLYALHNATSRSSASAPAAWTSARASSAWAPRSLSASGAATRSSAPR